MILNEFGQPYQREFAHGANRSRLRGHQYEDRHGDIDRLIPTHDRRKLAALSSRLYTNMGVPRDAIKQRADYSIGDAWLPKYVGTTDMEDGKRIAKFLHKVWFPSCEVRGGIHDWHKLLELTSIAIDRDGDAFWLLIKGKDGFPRIQQIPGHRVHSDSNTHRVTSGPFKGYRIKDGIICYSSGRPAAYRVLTGENSSDYLTFEDIPADSIIHFYDPSYQDQGRGLPAFTHALEDLKSCLASTEDERLRQQIISRLHLTIYNESGGPDLDDPAFAIVDQGGNVPDLTVKKMSGGIEYMTAGTGEKIEQIKHESPGDVWESFQDRMIRSSVASVWVYALCWKPTGQGTAERAEVLKARRLVTKRQRQLRYGARRAIAWAYACFQEAGRLPLLDEPFAWEFSTPPRLSVDDGRESKMELQEWLTGSRNKSELLEARGLTEEEFDMQRAWSVANRKIIARKVAEEATKASGFDIVIDDREMVLLTPNEPPERVAETETQEDDGTDPD
jgi:hypothetical protein